MRNHKPRDPQAILALVKLLPKLRELLQLNLQSQPVLAEAEEFALSSSLGNKTVAGSDGSCISSASFGIELI